ncbi:hypothetical protein PV10_07379 [Exophiala mesophila]|uniref:Monopolin complex subunit Csm1/Pcs1 C-terminal domain-containing protein n=1 Tax=Exophiala mesophila TaxID=212818 RepID=A0A0D1ZTE1_EXOME|nr:uncharacterized protein PV10_07379 [Exophiala mesophila]KIV90033.1 hypothetical protein PV10_07379 [Exophiala mesophila]
MKGIADLLDSDMEESTHFIDENSIISSASDATNTSSSQVKRLKKRKRVTMPTKPRSKVQKTTTARPRKAAPKQTAAKRMALEEQVNHRDVEQQDEEQVAEEVSDAAPVKPKKTSRAPAKPRANKKAAAAAAAAKEQDDEEMEVEQTPMVARSAHAVSKTKCQGPKATSKKTVSAKPTGQQEPRVIAESQDKAEQSEEVETEHVEVRVAPQPKQPVRDASKVRQEPAYRRRAGSASDTERGDPNLRRKLGDITRRFENVDMKYRNLKEVGINEANANMEKLRRQCDATVQASNELIASLKKELAAQAPQVQEAQKLKKQMQNQDNEVNKLRETATELGKSLHVAQNEIKALQAKLVAARATPVEQPKVPASVKKSGAQKPLMITNAEAAHAAQMAQLKEDLYSDLTGLIIRGVQRTKDGDSYDCLQTGRNGTLHFKLYMDHEDAKSTSFEETEFLYTPMLDANRDREMIELMPSYLTEDITFARQNAAKFYGRVVDTLTKRRAEE